MPLEPGYYAFTIESAPADTCWPGDTTWPPSGTTEVSLDVDESGFQLAVPEIVQWLFPPLHGTREMDHLIAGGSIVTHVSEECSISISAHLAADMTRENAFRGQVSFFVDAAVLTESGSPSDCSEMAGQRMAMVVPFPQLSEPARGACEVTINVNAVLK